MKFKGHLSPLGKMALGGLLTLLVVVLAFWILGVQPGFAPGKIKPPDVDPALLRKHVERLSLGFAPRDSEHPEILDQAAAYIRASFEAEELEVTEQKFEADGKPYKNVIAHVGRAGKVTQALIVVGAHYDSYDELPAADDNASGVAGLLELARLLSKQTPMAPVELVAYTLEEPPYFRTDKMGSAVHAQSLVDGRQAVRAMLSLEMIGYFSDEPWSQDFPFPLLRAFYPSRGNFIAVVGDLSNRGLAKTVKRSMNSVMKMEAYSINSPTFVPGIDFSDQMPYWNRGLPGVMITDTAFNRNKAYHTAQDLPNRLDYGRMAEVVAGVYQAVQDLAK